MRFAMLSSTSLRLFVLHRLGMCLIEANGDDNSSACKNIEAIMQELQVLFQYILAQDTKRTVDLTCSRLDGTQTASSDCVTAASTDHWHAVAKACNFDKGQQSEARILQDVTLSSMTKIFQERQVISNQLAASVPLHAGLGSKDVQIQSHIEALTLCAKLRLNLEQAQECMTHFHVAAKQIARPLQTAMGLVQSFPYMPDGLAIYGCHADASYGTAHAVSR